LSLIWINRQITSAQTILFVAVPISRQGRRLTVSSCCGARHCARSESTREKQQDKDDRDNPDDAHAAVRAFRTLLSNDARNFLAEIRARWNGALFAD